MHAIELTDAQWQMVEDVFHDNTGEPGWNLLGNWRAKGAHLSG